MIEKKIKIIEEILNRARFPDFNILDEEVKFLLQTMKSLELLLETEISQTNENEVDYIRGLRFTLNFLKKEYK